MKRVVMEELLPGMVLAKPVTNAVGLTILPAQAELDGPMIDRLRRLELASVYVEGDTGDTTGKTLAELQAELEHRFRGVHQDPVQQTILRHLKNHLQATHGMQERGDSIQP